MRFGNLDVVPREVNGADNHFRRMSHLYTLRLQTFRAVDLVTTHGPLMFLLSVPLAIELQPLFVVVIEGGPTDTQFPGEGLLRHGEGVFGSVAEGSR